MSNPAIPRRSATAMPTGGGMDGMGFYAHRSAGFRDGYTRVYSARMSRP